MRRNNDRHSDYGFFVTCDKCHGKQMINDALCPKCDGNGRLYIAERRESNTLGCAVVICLFLMMLAVVVYVLFFNHN
jgi:hypothetical protein